MVTGSHQLDMGKAWLILLLKGFIVSVLLFFCVCMHDMHVYSSGNWELVSV